MSKRILVCIPLLAMTLAVMLCVSSFAAQRPSVVFLNPGGKGDAFFDLMTDFMQAAADDLGFDLKVYYGERNHVVIDENITTVFSRQSLPDYIVGMNARDSGRTLLDKAEAAGVKTVFINQSFIGSERRLMGGPGQRYKQWLFEYLPSDIHSGYLLAKTLIEEAKARKLGDMSRLQLIAISGHEKSSASTLREQGLKMALAEYPNVELHQVVHAQWKRETAHDFTMRLLRRYPETTIVWAASDVMAHGACDGVRDLGKEPGRDILTGGVDWANSAMESLAKGEFTASVGGHFMDGGWALVMLYDMIHGVEVEKDDKSLFSVLTVKNVNTYVRHFGKNSWDKIDFRQFSKHDNPWLDEYDFSLEGVLQQVR